MFDDTVLAGSMFDDAVLDGSMFDGSAFDGAAFDGAAGENADWLARGTSTWDLCCFAVEGKVFTEAVLLRAELTEEKYGD